MQGRRITSLLMTSQWPGILSLLRGSSRWLATKITRVVDMADTPSITSIPPGYTREGDVVKVSLLEQSFEGAFINQPQAWNANNSDLFSWAWLILCGKVPQQGAGRSTSFVRVCGRVAKLF
mmetsp:Transcript_7597/g.12050  ORF Transcript_7597/g.12050 Transcript_7597/m.12050 type:complete len:121 (+) Transcript_7597:947-1309(+)